jgi:bacterioferritin
MAINSGKTNNDNLIKLLNEALQMEYVDIFLYPREASEAKSSEIAERFEHFGRMEVRHADSLAMQIINLGGVPKWDFLPIQSKKSLDEILLDHIDRERKAVHLYTNIIDVASENSEMQIELVLRGIKADEELHLNFVKELLKKGK